VGNNKNQYQKDRAIRVSSVQASPVLPMDKERTVEKVCDLISQAKKEKADLIVFPETFIPMYPNFSIDLSNSRQWRENLMELTRHSIYNDGEEIEKIAHAARDAKMHVVIGINEKTRDSEANLYNSQVFIDSDGKVLGVRRKLFPSNREKAFWSAGNEKDIKVYDTSIGRIGGLICYEHLQPLLKYSLMVQGEQIHCASWPGWPDMKNGRSNRHVIDASARQYALEGQCFVIVSALYIPPGYVPDGYFGNASWTFFGGSGIINPSGEYLAGPVYDTETIVYADIDLSEIIFRKALIDIAGRDRREDIFTLMLKGQEK
jgi:nitrilase